MQPSAERVRELIRTVLEGKRYLQMYDQLFITACVVVGYVLWIALCLLKLTSQDEKRKESPVIFLKGAFASSCVLAFAWLQRKQAPLQYYGYAFFPIYFGYQVSAEMIASTLVDSKEGLPKAVLDFALMAVRLPASFFDRRYMAVEFGAKAVQEALRKDMNHFKPASSAMLAVFGLLRPIKIPSAPTALSGAAAAMVFSAIAFVYRASKSRVLHSQIILLAATMGLVLHTDSSLSEKNGLPVANKYAGWLSLALCSLSLTMLKVHRRDHYLLRLLSIFIPLATVMILLSVNYEVYFFTVLAINLFFWLLEKQGDTAAMAREFLVYISGAFFGTGNIASISSFSLPSVYRLVTRFDPFLMGALLVVKLLVPFFLIGAVTWCKLRRGGVDQRQFFLWAMAQAELANIVFFFKVRDTGSWLEIGESISRFVISNCFMVVLLGLIGIGKLLVGGDTSFDDAKEDSRIRKNAQIPINFYLSENN